MSKNKNKVLLALSGGVDSSVAALVLMQRDFEVHGVYFVMSDAHRVGIDDALKVAEKLSIPFQTVDLSEHFKRNVIDYFVSTYLNAQTPNPCIVCNPKVKFEHLLNLAERQGFRYIATGHYAEIETDGGVSFLKKSASIERDQSYMLYRLEAKVLDKLIFPLGNMHKNDVRNIANTANLPSANSPDSQEICFIPNNDYADFIENIYGKMPGGQFIAPDGQVCGEHKGLLRYTIGQRKGLGIALGKPVFIREMNSVSGKIFLCYEGDIYINDIEIDNCIWNVRIKQALHDVLRQNKVSLDFPKTEICLKNGEVSFSAMAKIRSQQKAVSARIVLPANRPDCARVQFDNPQKATAKGQSCVIYSDALVVGGGFVC